MKYKFLLQPEYNYAFMDCEFNKIETEIKNVFNFELISVGIVITDAKLNIKEKIYSVIRPVNFNRLHSDSKQLTGLTNQDIEAAPTFRQFINKNIELFEKYNIKHFFTYDIHDKAVIQKEYEKNNIKDIGKFIVFYNKIYDIKPVLNSVLPYNKTNNWGLTQVSKYYNVKEYNKHNALDDAIVLEECFKKYLDNYHNPYYYNKLKKTVQNSERTPTC